MSKSKDKAGPARPEIDITPTWPSRYDPMPPWPYTVPRPRETPYGEQKGEIKVLVIPGKIEYDPCMNTAETMLWKLQASGKEVTIVVPDVHRGPGEIMSRRLGANLLVVNTATAGSIDLPTMMQRHYLDSAVARKYCVAKADRVIIVRDSPVFDAFMKTIKKAKHSPKVKILDPKYVKRKSAEQIEEEQANRPRRTKDKEKAKVRKKIKRS